MSVGSTVVSAIVVIALIIGLMYMLWFMYRNWTSSNASSPWLVKDTRIARQGLVIPGNMIPLSNDGRFGMEFSYSMWIYVNQWDTPVAQQSKQPLKHILHKGDSSPAPVFQAPGIWMDQSSNEIVVVMNTFNKTDTKDGCVVSNIPIGLWVNLIVICIENKIDIYVNGGLKNRCTLNGIPMQNMGDVYITQNGGYDGFISKVRYYNYALPYWKVEQILADGPSKAPCTETGATPPYQSIDYWLQRNKQSL